MDGIRAQRRTLTRNRWRAVQYEGVLGQIHQLAQRLRILRWDFGFCRRLVIKTLQVAELKHPAR